MDVCGDKLYSSLSQIFAVSSSETHMNPAFNYHLHENATSHASFFLAVLMVRSSWHLSCCGTPKLKHSLLGQGRGAQEDSRS
ncbi:mCG1041734 [Mus musculus]|nr:mCG1041734 [Mus musculus]